MSVAPPTDSTNAHRALETGTNAPVVCGTSVVASPEATDSKPDLEPRAYARTMRRILVVLVGVGVAIRIARLVIPSPIWGDEAMLALNFIDRDYEGLTHCLDNGQVAPILFLWAERFILVTLGSSDWAMRLVPFLTSVGGVFLFWDFARRTVSPTAATLAVGMMAVSVWPVSMAATAKPYACDLFWSAMLLALAARWHQRPERLWPLVGLVAAVPFALGSSYPVVFVAGAVSVYLLPVAWRARRPVQALFLSYNLAMLAAFATTYLVVGRAQIDPAASTTGSFMRWYWRYGFLPEYVWQWPLWFLQANTGRMFAYPLGDSNGGSTATTLLCMMGVWWCWRNGSRPLLVVCLVPFALNLVATALGKYPYAGCCRLSQHVAPAICLLAGVGWAYVLELYAPRRTDRLGLVRWAVGFLIVFGTVELVHRCVKVDHDQISRFSAHLHNELNEELQPGDRIVVRDLAACDATTQWYLKRFGDRVVDLHAGEPLPTAERLWIITTAANKSPEGSHQKFVESAKGWQLVETFSFTVRPNLADGQDVWWYTSMTCLVHPGDTRPPPRLNVVP